VKRVDFELRGEHITLDALLKATGLAASGGGAKAMIADGRVQVDGREELRKTCKIRGGQVVGVTGARVHVNAPAPEPEPVSEPPAAPLT
jgi:ribosome-associated protein